MVNEAHSGGLVFWAVLLCLLGVAGLAHAQPVPAHQWTQRARLNLAASCVSEAGFDSFNTGECAAIAHLYARRWHLLRSRGRRVSFQRLIWQYSSPLRTGRRQWVRNLRASDRRPRGMPRHLWRLVVDDWQSTIELVDQWYAGSVGDPCPGSEHFGSVQDGAPRHWSRIECVRPMRNCFYSLP